jgi:hypothetical protein
MSDTQRMRLIISHIYVAASLTFGGVAGRIGCLALALGFLFLSTKTDRPARDTSRETGEGR